jgi:hypothetical protein
MTFLAEVTCVSRHVSSVFFSRQTYGYIYPLWAQNVDSLPRSGLTCIAVPEQAAVAQSV